jgi:hypothetical protein
MKKDVLAIGLVGVVMISTLATVGMCYWYLKTSRDVRYQQSAMTDINRGMARNRQALQSLALDLNNYARRNPAIIPLLEQMNLRMDLPTNSVAGGRP